MNFNDKSDVALCFQQFSTCLHITLMVHMWNSCAVGFYSIFTAVNNRPHVECCSASGVYLVCMLCAGSEMLQQRSSVLYLEDGSSFTGYGFGAARDVSGEVGA